MIKIFAKDKWLTQVSVDNEDDRIFVKNSLFTNFPQKWRDASDAEVAEWEEYKRKQEEFVA